MPSWTELKLLSGGQWAQRRLAVLDAASVLEKLVERAAASLLDELEKLNETASSTRGDDHDPAAGSFRANIQFLARHRKITQRQKSRVFELWKLRVAVAHDFMIPTLEEARSAVRAAHTLAMHLETNFPAMDVASITTPYPNGSFLGPPPPDRRTTTQARGGSRPATPDAIAVSKHVGELVAMRSPWTAVWHARVRDALKWTRAVHSSSRGTKERDAMSELLVRLVYIHDDRLWSYRYGVEDRFYRDMSVSVRHPSDVGIHSLYDLEPWRKINAVDVRLIPLGQRPIIRSRPEHGVVECPMLERWLDKCEDTWGYDRDTFWGYDGEVRGIPSAKDAWDLMRTIEGDPGHDARDRDAAVFVLATLTKDETDDGLTWLDGAGRACVACAVECIASEGGDHVVSDIEAMDRLVQVFAETLNDPPPFLGDRHREQEIRMREVASAQAEFLAGKRT